MLTQEGKSQKGHIQDSGSLTVTVRAELLVFSDPQFSSCEREQLPNAQGGFVGQMNKAEDRMADRLKDRESACCVLQGLFSRAVPKEKGSIWPQ